MEKKFTIHGLKMALNEGRLLEAFVPTVYIVNPVGDILAPTGTTLAVLIRDKKSTGSFYGQYAKLHKKLSE